MKCHPVVNPKQIWLQEEKAKIYPVGVQTLDSIDFLLYPL